MLLSTSSIIVFFTIIVSPFNLRESQCLNLSHIVEDADFVDI